MTLELFLRGFVRSFFRLKSLEIRVILHCFPLAQISQGEFVFCFLT